MKSVRILSIIGTRPELIKMMPVVRELENFKDKVQSIVLTTAQHREMLDQMVSTLSVHLDYDLDLMLNNQHLYQISRNILERIPMVLNREKPDIILTQGDTTTTFIASLAAFYQKITIAHIEAGLRTFNKYYPYPEEMNRRLTSVLADYHFAPTLRAKNNLLKEGIESKKIFVTGNTVVDALSLIHKSPSCSENPVFKKDNFQEKKVILVTAHRRENFGEPLKNISLALKKLVNIFEDIEIIFPLHLNPNVKNMVEGLLGNIDRIHLVGPLDYITFIHLISRSYLILSDSGGIQEEAPSFGKPVLVMRDVTERPEGIEVGAVKLVGTDTQNIIQHVSTLIQSKEEYHKMSQTKNPYGDGKAAIRIVGFLLYKHGLLHKLPEEYTI